MDIIDREKRDIITPDFFRAVDYPSAKFIRDGWKPELKLHTAEITDMQALRGYTYAFAQGGKVGPSIVAQYLYTMMKDKIKDELTEVWTSYKVTLPVGTVRPIDLIAVTVDESLTPPTIASPTSLSDDDDDYLMLLIMCMYRHAHAHEKHKEIIASRANGLLVQAKKDISLMDKIAGVNPNSVHLMGNATIDMLVACIDMFLEKFPSHPFSKARFGSIVTRFQGCSGYSNLSYLARLLGKETIGDAAEWFFATQFRLEIKQMVATSREEWDKKNSYLPYMMCLRLSDKSPFSATNNPALHLLIHTVGTLLGAQRSQHAIMVENISVLPIIVNAAIIFLGHKQSVELRPIFMQRGAMENYFQKQREHAEMVEEDGDETEVLDTPLKWILHFQERRFLFSRNELNSIHMALEKINEPRAGTEDSYL